MRTPILLTAGAAVLLALPLQAEEPAPSPAARPLFNLFGQPVNRDAQNVAGEMPEGELDTTPDANAPRLFSNRRNRSSSSKPVSRGRRIVWTQPQQSQMNTSGRQQATHLVQRSGRVFLRSY